MTRKSAQQMFGKVVRDIAAAERAEREDAERCRREEAAAEARLDGPLTRRDVIDAIEATVFEYECNGTEQSDAIAAAFRKLAERLS